MRGAGPFRSTLGAALLLALPAAGAPLSLSEQARVFADCAGRYAAMTEHLWMVDGPASDLSARHRDQFRDLLDAIAPDLTPADAAQLITWRVTARAAQRTLLDISAFVADDAQRRRAAELAADYLATCDRLIAGT
jgi:hypothetical protein